MYRGRLDQSARPSISEGNAVESSISTSADQESDTMSIVGMAGMRFNVIV